MIAKKNLLFFIVVILLILAVYLFVKYQADDSVIDSSDRGGEYSEIKEIKPLIPNAEEIVGEFNKNNQEKQARRKEFLENQPDNYQEIEDKHYKNLIGLSKSQIREITFHGEIIDQFGEPVPEVEISYTGHRSTFATGSGIGIFKSNKDGIFTINAKGKAMSINSYRKIGYQFPKRQHFKSHRSRDGQFSSWREFTEDTPYIVRAWKIDRYPETISNRKPLGFIPDGRDYTVDFLSTDKIKNEGVTEGDLRIRFKRDDKKWQVIIEAVNGGIIETDDFYRNLAPENGYIAGPKIYSYEKTEKKRDTRSVYFVSRNGKTYGSINMKFMAYGHKKRSTILMNYTVNLEDGRNLTVKKE